MTIVSARFYRNEVGTGECLISSGFPVPPGLVTTTLVTERKIKVLVGTTEQAVNITALRGRHNDGSVRSVLIQFRYTMAQGDSVAATVVFDDGVRTTTDITYTRPVYAMVFDANNCILPEGAEYLCSTGLVFRNLIPAGEGSAVDEKLYTALAEDRFDSLVISASYGGASYDQCAAKLALWCRQGSGVKYWNATLVEMRRGLTSATPSASGMTPPCIADAVANPDGRDGTNCGLPSEWDSTRYYSFAAAYLMTGYRDFWGVVAYFVQRQQWNVASLADAQTKVIPYSVNGRARWNSFNKYGALIPALMIDATIPVTGQYHTGRTLDFEDQISWTVDGMLHSEWNIRWVPYSEGSGTVPLNYTTITQGGASASLWGVYSARNIPKIAEGAAMPTTGWLMLSGVTGSFAAGALTGIAATATGADEADYRNGFVGVKANSPLGGGADERIEFQTYQSIFPTNFLIDYYLYVKRDSRIPAIVKKTVDAVLANVRPSTVADTYHNQGGATWGYVSWVSPYLWENPINTAPAPPWNLPMFTRMVAFILKTLGDSTVNGRLLSAWYDTLADTANVNPSNVLTWQWKIYGEVYGFNTDVPWMMSQTSLVDYGPTAVKAPIQYTTIPDDGVDPIVPDPEEPEVTEDYDFGSWVLFDGSMPPLSLAATCPGSLLEVQEWTKANITKKQIDKVSP